MTDTPFKAGESYRTRDGDAAGIDREDGREPYPLLGWIDDGDGKFTACWNRKGHWHGDRNACPGRNLVPTPPADDLAAARAEIERLREALESIAEEHDAGRHDGLPEPCPAHEAEVMWHIARAALLPSPPDAKAADCRRCQGSGAEPPHEDVECKECGGTGRRSAKPAPERERLKGWCWVNVHSYGHASASERRHLADEYAEEDARTYGPRIACIPVDLSQHHVGEGLEP